MLRITRKYLELPWVILILEGHIVGEWVAVLERECLELGRAGLGVVLDLAGVVFVGRSGLEALGRLGRSGVGIIGCPALLADMLEQDGLTVGRIRVVRSNGRFPGKGNVDDA